MSSLVEITKLVFFPPPSGNYFKFFAFKNDMFRYHTESAEASIRTMDKVRKPNISVHSLSVYKSAYLNEMSKQLFLETENKCA
jgi:hypothetical protein